MQSSCALLGPLPRFILGTLNTATPGLRVRPASHGSLPGLKARSRCLLIKEFMSLLNIKQSWKASLCSCFSLLLEGRIPTVRSKVGGLPRYGMDSPMVCLRGRGDPTVRSRGRGFPTVRSRAWNPGVLEGPWSYLELSRGQCVKIVLYVMAMYKCRPKIVRHSYFWSEWILFVKGLLECGCPNDSVFYYLPGDFRCIFIAIHFWYRNNSRIYRRCLWGHHTCKWQPGNDTYQTSDVSLFILRRNTRNVGKKYKRQISGGWSGTFLKLGFMSLWRNVWVWCEVEMLAASQAFWCPRPSLWMLVNMILFILKDALCGISRENQVWLKKNRMWEVVGLFQEWQSALLLQMWPSLICSRKVQNILGMRKNVFRNPSYTQDKQILIMNCFYILPLTCFCFLFLVS